MNADSPLEKLKLTPINYFEVELDLCKLSAKEKTPGRSHLLPDLSAFTREEIFAALFMAWSPEGIHVRAEVDSPPEFSTFPDVERSDGLELFFDTRDIKSAGFNHKFCHHFVFLLEAVEGTQKAEVTHFRTEDRHELCDSTLLELKATRKKQSYSLEIFIPAACLVGYDPAQFDRLGFSYRFNRAQGDPQHFTVASDEFKIDQNPSLWASMRLVS